VGQNLDSVRIAFIEYRSEWTVHTIGPTWMDQECSACQALHWQAERLRAQNAKRARAGTFEACCNHGDVMVERMRALPEPLNNLMTGQDSQSRLFREHIRHWNALFAFTSIRFNADDCTGVNG